jgi:NAD(P)-dependent dehydrogenase (short-subunit alcohol dehydrogenase family)
VANREPQLGVTKHTAWRFHDEGIRCNAVLPGCKSPFLPTPKAFVNRILAIDTNIGASIEKDHFDEDTFSRLQ